ncbi:MAG: SCO family protein [Chromatiaceae bacterium]
MARAAPDPPEPVAGQPPPGPSLCEFCARPEAKDLEHCRLQEGMDRTTATVAPQGGDFTLEAASGPVDLASLRGQVVLIYFGYTLCPDISPTNLAMIGRALKSMTPEERERVRGLFVSVDPERDDPQRLAQYAAYFHPNILGVTGNPEQVARAAELYGAIYRRVAQADSAMAYLVDHSADTYVVDTQGRWVHTFPHATPATEILAFIRGLLAKE